jgi:pimeloyl-ACP methyl ester carboxylesterase
MPYLTTKDNVKLYYEDAGGNGIPVIFSHGFGSGSKLWRFQIPVLIESGYRPIVWDMRAHAKSEGPEDVKKYSKLTQVNDLKAVCDTCGIKKAIFVGHSMGGK